MSNIFYYNGSGTTSDIDSLWIGDYVNELLTVVVFYGDIQNADGPFNPPSITAPVNLPVLPDNLHHMIDVKMNLLPGFSTDYLPGKEDSKPKYLGRQDLFEITDNVPGKYLGTKFFFLSRNLMVDSKTFVFYWSIPSFTVNYGTDKIQVSAQQGHSSMFTISD